MNIFACQWMHFCCLIFNSSYDAVRMGLHVFYPSLAARGAGFQLCDLDAVSTLCIPAVIS